MVSFVLTSTSPLRGDRAVRHHFPSVDRELALRFLKEGRIRRGGHVARLHDVFSPGDTVILEASAEWLGQPRVAAFSILYDAPGVIVVDKAAGVAMHEGGLLASADEDEVGESSEDVPLSRLLNETVALEEGFPGVSFLGRIDRATSGLVVAATSRSTSKILNELWTSGILRKSYLVVVHGKTLPEGKIDVPLAARRGARKGTGVIEEAITLYRSLAHGEGISLLLATLVTGRTHQIRRHMKAIRHPVVGDARYGDKKRDAKRQKVNGLMLHSWKLENDDEKVAALLPKRIAAAWPTRIREFLDANGIAATATEAAHTTKQPSYRSSRTSPTLRKNSS